MTSVLLVLVFRIPLWIRTFARDFLKTLNEDAQEALLQLPTLLAFFFSYVLEVFSFWSYFSHSSASSSPSSSLTSRKSSSSSASVFLHSSVMNAARRRRATASSSEIHASTTQLSTLLIPTPSSSALVHSRRIVDIHPIVPTMFFLPFEFCCSKRYHAPRWPPAVQAKDMINVAAPSYSVLGSHGARLAAPLPEGGEDAVTTDGTTTAGSSSYNKRAIRRPSAASSVTGGDPASLLLLSGPSLAAGIPKPKIYHKVLALDLDETMIYAVQEPAPSLPPLSSTEGSDSHQSFLDSFSRPPNFSEVVPTMDGAKLFHIWERPYLQEFLAAASRWYNIAIFTASLESYADPIINRIDRHKYIKRRFYRQDCTSVSSPTRPLQTPTTTNSSTVNPAASSLATKSSRHQHHHHHHHCIQKVGSGKLAQRKKKLTASSRGGYGVTASSNENYVEDEKELSTTSCSSSTSDSDSNSNSDSPERAKKRTKTSNTTSTSWSSLKNEKNNSSSACDGTSSTQQRWIKDLSRMSVPLESVILVDNSLDSFIAQPDNGLFIPTYNGPPNTKKKQQPIRMSSQVASSAANSSTTTTFSNATDTASDDHGGTAFFSNIPSQETDDELLKLIPILEAMYFSADVRYVLRFGNHMRFI